MIEPTNPDAPFIVNGVQVTGRQLAEVRQELSHRGVHNPRWAELSKHDQDMGALAAGNYLRALYGIAPGPDVPSELEPSPAQLGETATVQPGGWYPLDDHGTEIYVYGNAPVDIAFKTADPDDELRELRYRNEMQQRRMHAATELWRSEDPEARALTAPDLGDLLQWLMEQASRPNCDI